MKYAIAIAGMLCVSTAQAQSWNFQTQPIGPNGFVTTAPDGSSAWTMPFGTGWATTVTPPPGFYAPPPCCYAPPLPFDPTMAPLPGLWDSE